MKNIGLAILAVCLGTLGSMAAQAQSYNTKLGTGALYSNTTGSSDTAVGGGALEANTTGYGDTAFGAWSLQRNTIGIENTAIGVQSLSGNTSGNDNTANGAWSLSLTTTGYDNTGNGAWSLYANTFGSDNTASGYQSLYNNTSGDYNTANGYASLFSTTTGAVNVGIGSFALYSNNSGTSNIGIGNWAGYYNPAGASNNIDIGSYGWTSDDGVIRIGSLGAQTAFYAAGINGAAISGPVPVYINSNGQLGTINSSIRFKEDVRDMAAASDGLMRLRPVTYRYKEPYADGSKPIDYGLIAEEVAEVYPDLVVKDVDGQIQTVQYQKLTPMLLNEVQKEHKLLEQQAETIQRLEKRLAALEAALPSTKAETQLAEK
jgi:hypothetical protein